MLEPAPIPPNPTGDLPIPLAHPYEGCADGKRFRLCRVRASGKSAKIGSQGKMTGARWKPLSNRSGANVPRHMAPIATQATPMPLRLRTGRTLARDARISSENAAAPVPRQAARTRAKLRLRSAPPPHRGLEFMFEAQVQVRSEMPGGVHAALAGLRTFAACPPPGFRSVPFTDNRSGTPFLRRCGAESAEPTLMRSDNGQQNAYRRDPSGGDPGGRPARQPRRRIRLRVRAP